LLDDVFIQEISRLEEEGQTINIPGIPQNKVKAAIENFRGR
jgi:hypothetical protein